MIRTRTVQCFLSIFAVLASTVLANAGIETDPYLFEDSLGVTPTGQFDWDEFGGTGAPVTGTHSPDGGSAGIGAAALDMTFTAQPQDGPPFALLTSTDNIYAGGTLMEFDLNLSGLDTTEASTTVVLQIATLGPLDPASVLLDGAAPTEFVFRGTKPDVVHDTDETNSAFDTSYYWAEWQVAADTDYLIEFSHLFTHTSFTGARADYLNSATPFNAQSPSIVPEPASLGLMTTAMLVLLRRRRGK